MSAASGLPLQSFEVEGYRAIRHLRLPDLARVNLFVGRNNAGKTSLLEAVRLYASAGSMSVLSEIIRAQSGIGESSSSGVRRTAADVERSFDTARSLFNAAHQEPCETITLGPADAPADRLRIWLEAAGSGAGSEPTVRLERGGQSRQIPLTLLLSGTTVRPWSAGVPAESVPAQGVESERLGELWSRAVETGRVPLVEDALRVLIPDLERIYLIGSEAAPRFAIKIRDIPRPVLVNAEGRGVQRWFGIALAFVAAEGGVLLIDQVDAALHHWAQGEVWETIFALAERLNLQVFATTHSWDAVAGFQYGASRSSATGLLYRLDVRQGGGMIYGMRYTAEEVVIAVEQQIEVR